jgi:hypothetical protein
MHAAVSSVELGREPLTLPGAQRLLRDAGRAARGLPYAMIAATIHLTAPQR